MAIKLKKKRTAHLLFAEIIVGVFTSVFSVWVFFVLTHGVLTKQTDLFDTVVTYLIQYVRSPAVTEFMFIVTMLGGPGILAIWLVTAIILSLYKRNRRSLMFLVMTVSGFAFNILLKLIFQRPRPSDAPLVDEYFYSYPSGHAMNSFIFYLFIAYMYFHYTRNKTVGLLGLIFAAILVLLIGISRVYLGVHYPSDVLAGYIGGLWWLVTVIVLEKIFVAERLMGREKK